MGVVKRPEILTGYTRKVNTGCGYLYITVNFKDNVPFEIFAQLGKAGGCASAQLQAITRLASICMRGGTSHEEIIEQLRGISCPSKCWHNGEVIESCADAIAKTLEMLAERELA